MPDWVFTSDEIYRRELDRIFHGDTWNYLGIEAEIPNKGDFKIGYVGANPVVVVRGGDGAIHALKIAARIAAPRSASRVAATPRSSCAPTTSGSMTSKAI